MGPETDLSANHNVNLINFQADFTPSGAPKLPRGISLFAPIPSNRSCFQAEIPSQFCPCFKEYELPPENGTTYADMILAKIHKYFEEKQVTVCFLADARELLPGILSSLQSMNLFLGEVFPDDNGFNQNCNTLDSTLPTFGGQKAAIFEDWTLSLSDSVLRQTTLQRSL